jgi:hypothetical protein
MGDEALKAKGVWEEQILGNGNDCKLQVLELLQHVKITWSGRIAALEHWKLSSPAVQGLEMHCTEAGCRYRRCIIWA